MQQNKWSKPIEGVVIVKISLKKGLEIPKEVSNSFSFEYLKSLVKTEIDKIDDLTLLIDSEMTDEEYLEKAQKVYEINIEEVTDNKDASLIKTSIPSMSVLNRDTPKEYVVWRKRIYEALVADEVDMDTEYDEEALMELVNNGKVVLINAVPGSRVKYEYGYMLRSSNADKMPMLSNMSIEDEGFKSVLGKAVRKYTKERLKSDRDSLVERLKEALEYLKIWGKRSSDITRERLIVEEEVFGYCNTLLDGFEKRKQK